jgi:DNA-binding NarL/FixJ family response regulator
VSPEAVGDLGNTTHHPLSGPPPSQLASALSAQERLIISLIVVGYTNRAIANYLSLSESTIHRRIVRIFATLGVSDKFELVLFAVDRGIIEDLPDDTDESS